jgi:tRNA-dependent cyclodipeptide synthase
MLLNDVEKKSADMTAKIKRVTPSVPTEQLFASKRCYLGISIDHPQFGSAFLRAQLTWVRQHFSECIIVIGDYINRFNEQIFGGRKSIEAISAALRKGDVCISDLNNVLETLPPGNFEVVRWKSLLEAPAFVEAKQVVHCLFLTNPAFRNSIEQTANDFIYRQLRRQRPLAVSYANAVALSCEYLLEEIGVFSALVELGWIVDVYPGEELPVLVEIANGKFPNVPASLLKRINVQLDVKTNRS